MAHEAVAKHLLRIMFLQLRHAQCCCDGDADDDDDGDDDDDLIPASKR